MRINLQDFRANHGDTTRVVLFQLAALTADYFLLFQSNISTAKKARNGAYALALHGIAYKAAKFFESPKVQSAINETKVTEGNEETLSTPTTSTSSTRSTTPSTLEPTSPLDRPVTP